MSNAADVQHDAAARLIWPSRLADGFDALHVVHDVAWTKAVVWHRRHGESAHAGDITLSA